MTMSRTDLVTDLKSILMDSKSKLSDPVEFNLHLDLAAADLTRVCPLIVPGELTLVAGTAAYAAPSDLLNPLYLQWSEDIRQGLQPWDDNWPGRLPSMSITKVGVDRMILLSPPPTAKQISVLGSTAAYMYSAKQAIADLAENTTVPESSRHLLLIRAAASALQSLANRGAAKPVTLGGKAGMSLPKNGTPQALADQLMDLFERMAKG